MPSPIFSGRAGSTGSPTFVPNTGQRWMFRPGTSLAGQTRIGRTFGFQGGRFGAWDQRAPGQSRRFTELPNMVQRSPLQYSNPAAYARQQLIEQQQEAMDEAKRQTEERFQQAMGNLENVGVQERADIGTRFDASRAAVNQSLVSSGLAGTTVLPSMQRGVERERTAARRRLETDLARERNQLLAARNDIPPDIGRFAELLRLQGAGGIG